MTYFKKKRRYCIFHPKDKVIDIKTENVLNGFFIQTFKKLVNVNYYLYFLPFHKFNSLSHHMISDFVSYIFPATWYNIFCLFCNKSFSTIVLFFYLFFITFEVLVLLWSIEYPECPVQRFGLVSLPGLSCLLLSLALSLSTTQERN